MKAGDGDREDMGLMGRAGSHCFQRRGVVNQSCTLNSLVIICITLGLSDTSFLFL